LVTSLFKTLAATNSLLNHSHAKPNSPPAEDNEGPEKTADNEAADAAPEVVGPKTEKRLVDPSAQPDAATIEKYWSYGWGYVVKDSTGFHATSKIIYPK